MTREEVVASFPLGWRKCIDTVCDIMEQNSISFTKIIGTRRAGGYPVFFTAPLTFREYNVVAPVFYSIGESTYKTCIDCGAKAVYHDENGTPMCLEHFKQRRKE